MRATAEGRRLVLATFLIAAAAINTGNNLIYLILAMMMSILAVSYTALLINLRGLVLTVNMPRPVFAMQGAYMEMRIRNTKGLFGSYSLRIGLPEGIEGGGVFGHVPSRSSVTVEIPVLFRRRGVYQYGDFLIESCFPFIFFTKKTRVRVEGEAVVYPETRELDEAVESSGYTEGSATFRHGRGEDLLSVRELTESDDMRSIHWKASAKREKLMVKEFSEEMPRTITIVLDNASPPAPEAFEHAVSLAASFSQRFVREGMYVGLLACGRFLEPGGGVGHLYRLLDVMARIGEEDFHDCPKWEDIDGSGLLILKSRDSMLGQLAPFCDKVVYAPDV
jgi:uncharacterized protein (DUF58 family)